MHSHRQEEADIQRLGATGERSVVGPPSGPSAASRHQQVEDRAPVHADTRSPAGRWGSSASLKISGFRTPTINCCPI